MTSLTQHIADLSPEKRRLLELLLKKQGVDLAKAIIAPRTRPDGIAGVSFAQQRLWFLDRLEPGTPLYTIPMAVHLSGRLDYDRLRRAVNTIVERHETLRTTFVERGGQPVQLIAPAGLIEIPLTDLANLPESERETEAHRLAQEEARRPFDLACGPLLRIALIRLADEEHIALLTMHHIISDGWSMGVLLSELAELYDRFSRGHTAQLPPLPIQYADYAEWQRDLLQGAERERQLDYWKAQLGPASSRGAPPLLELPADRPRPVVQSPRGGSCSRKLPQELTGTLTTLAQTERATLFMVLLAAFQTLLFRYSGQEDFCVGTPVAGRTRAELEPLIGFFVNTLVLRADLAGAATFRELLRRTRETALGAFAHQDLPFEMLVEALQPERHLNRTPLFQVMFILQNTPPATHHLAELSLRQIDTQSGTATFDLTLSITVQPDGMLTSLEYSADLFDAATVVRMLEHFERLLGGIVANPDMPVAHIPLLDEAERRRMLAAWSEIAHADVDTLRVHRVFEAWAARQPDAPCVACNGQRLSYGELNARANRLAHRLRSLGIGPDRIVGVRLERSVDVVVALLGILKAGGAYLPLDLHDPDERLRFILEDARPTIVVTTRNVMGAITASMVPSVLDISDPDMLASEPADDLDGGSGPGDLAYVIYTSGSTGTPKGVMVEHRAIAAHCLAIAHLHELTPGDVALQFSSLTFDASLEQILPALTTGGAVVLRGEDFWSPAELAGQVAAYGITWMDLPTAYWHQVASDWTGGGSYALPDCLRLVTLGGEAMRTDLAQRWLAGPTAHIRLINTYGPTETTISATIYEPRLEEIQQHARVPIGRPLGQRFACILDSQLQPVPVGVPGELCIGGAGVARGYLNRPELTTERFLDFGCWMLDVGLEQSQIQHPTSNIYKTGDRCRYLPDGKIEFLGRSDDQVKIRGYRVEPGEVEAILTQHPSVHEAVVVAQEDRPGEARLVAYVVLGDGEWGMGNGKQASGSTDITPTTHHPTPNTQLRAWLAERLPEYMLPAAFVPLDALPLTPSGKIDRRALPAAEAEHTADDRAYVAPRTRVEEQLAGIWVQLLRVEQVSTTAGFFELGGHSLLATQLVSRIREAFGTELPVRAVFETPDLASLAARIETAHRAAGPQAPPIQPVARDGELPLSFGQQRLWFLDQLEPGSPLYNMPDAVRLIGALDGDALHRALQTIVQRHEALRTSFPTVDGRPRQVIHPAIELPLPTTDLRVLAPEARQAEALRLIAEEAQRPFDLARGPLLRARLLRLADDEQIALLTLHHIVSDGWSSVILTRELALLYDAFANGRESPLPDLPIQYADYAAWQRSWLQGETLVAQLAYWRTQLAGDDGGGPPVLRLPADRPRPAVQTSRGAHHAFTLPDGLGEPIEALARQEGATVFMVLLAVFQALLHRYSGQDDLTVGTPIAGRTRVETEGLIGFFANTLVLRARFDGQPSFRTLLRQVRETALDAYAHQDVPFEMVVDALQPERDLSHTPLFQVMFLLQTTPPTSQDLPASGLTVRPLDPDTGVSNFELTLALEQGPDGLRGGFEYNTDLFDAATIERMQRHFTALLAAAVADPDRPVAALPMLSAAEQQQLLVEWNGKAQPWDTTACLHDLFTSQAARTPGAVAVTYGDRSLTYDELDRRSNQLAHYLVRQGIGPDVPVALMLERSLELAVALLGVLKAGGAYLPIDPYYPDERIAFMLEDAQPGVVLVATTNDDRRADFGLGAPTNDERPTTKSERRTANGERRTTNDGAKNDSGFPLVVGRWSVVDLVADWPAIAQEPETQPDGGAGPEHLAYIIYTSGSTGAPKGVPVPHRAVVNHNRAVIAAFGLTPADRVLQFATITFDAAVEEIFPTWAAGGALVFRPAGPLPSAAELLELIAREQLTVLDLPTAYWHAWAAELARSGAQLPETLRLVVVGGEAASAEHLATWRSIAPGVRWINTYGPTEATVIATLYEPDSDPPRGAAIPIGRPIANTSAYVLDRLMQPTPIGVQGELYIGGAGVARGYLNRPDLTAERFLDFGFWILDSGLTAFKIQHPKPILSDVEGSKMYRTGDRARWRADGVLEFLGRTDDQVKIRGFRVELGEIEHTLRQHPGVREAAVLAREDTPEVKRLVAYVVRRDEGERMKDEGSTDGTVSSSFILHPSSFTLRDWLHDRLPDYMIPAVFVELEVLPLTQSGKVDRRKLPAPEVHFTEGQTHNEPTTPAEQALAAIWAEVLRVPRVGINDNFFELGGDSILSIQVIARANQAGLGLTPRQLFETPTIAQLAATAGAGKAVHAEQGLITGPAPLTPIQRWFFAQQFPAPHHWNQTLLLETREPLEPAALDRAVAALLAHHDALRLRFTHTQHGWEQSIAGFVATEHIEKPQLAAGSAASVLSVSSVADLLRFVDLAHMTADQQSTAIETVAAELQASLDLASGPLLRVGAFNLGAGRPGRLLLVVHHLAVDGVSWRILLEDLYTAYTRALHGQAPTLPPKTTSFQYWAGRLAEYARSAALLAELPMWQAIAGGPIAPLPLDRPGGDNTEESARAIVVALDQDETTALLQDVPPVYRTEINDVLLTALIQACERWTGEPAVLLELEGHGREDLFDDVDLSRTVGWFTTIYPVRLDLANVAGPGEALKAIKEQLRRAPNHGIGYGLLRYLAGDESAGQLADLPEPQISFNYLGQFDQALPREAAFAPAQEARGPDRDARGRRSTLLEVTGSVVGGCLRVEWTYSANQYDDLTIDWLAQDFIAALRELIAHCRSPEAGGYTPSDFGLAALDQQQLDRLARRFG